MIKSRKLKQQLVDDFLKRKHPDLFSETATAGGLQLCEKMATLPFWCGNDTLHIDNPDYQDEFCCTNHVLGLPRHPATNEEMPLTPYQIEFANEIIRDTTPPSGRNTKSHKKKIIQFLKKSHFYHINKGRQMGFTEIVLRLIAHFSFTRYAGNNVGIIAGTNGHLAAKNLRRLARLYKNIPIVVSQWITNKTFKMVNGTVFEAFSSNEESMTGDHRYKCIFMDESGKWRNVDDTPVFNSVEPIVRAAGGDLFLVSTPKGPQKMFYKIHKAVKSEYKKLKYDIMRTLGNLYDQEQIDTMLNSATSDKNQEYLCKFTTSEDAIFGIISDEDRGSGWTEWGQEETDDAEQDDGFEEDDSDWDDIHEE